MEATINQSGGEHIFPINQEEGKSDLMLFFERQVSDIYWAHRDLLKAILESNDEE